MATSSAALLLGRQFKQMQTDKDIPGISCGLVNNNVLEWEVMLMLDDESGGLYGESYLCLSVRERGGIRGHAMAWAGNRGNDRDGSLLARGQSEDANVQQALASVLCLVPWHTYRAWLQ